MAPTVVLANTVETLELLCQELRTSSECSLDLEGVNLGDLEQSRISIAIVGLKNGTTYLVDFVVLNDELLQDSCPFRAVLADPSIKKIMFDCRSDCRALHKQFRMSVQGVLDLQIPSTQRIVRPPIRFIVGLQKTVEKLLPLQNEVHRRLKEAGKKLFAPEVGGSYEVWMERPLRQELVRYCVSDAHVPFQLLALFNFSSARVAEVMRISAGRRDKAIVATSRQNAEVDW